MRNTLKNWCLAALLIILVLTAETLLDGFDR